MYRSLVSGVLLWGLLQGCADRQLDEGSGESGGCLRGAATDTIEVQCDEGFVITEIMPAPGAGSDFEWFEVLNPTDAELALDGIVITRGDNDLATIAGSGVVVPPGGYAVLGKTTAVDPGTGKGPVLAVDAAYGNDISLVDSDAELCLSCPGSAPMDCVHYWDGEYGWPEIDKGVSLSLDPGQATAPGNDEGEAWCQAATQMANGDLGTPGEPNDACPVQVPCPADAQLVITEILPDTLLADDIGEYVEITNVGSEPVPLTCIAVLHRSDGTDGDPTTCAGELSPGGYVVVTDDAGELAALGVQGACEDRSIALTNSGEVVGVGLLDDQGGITVIDQVDCASQDCPYEAGVAMQLDPSRTDAALNDDAASWCEADTPYGDGDVQQWGTPGAPNTDCGLPVDGDLDGWLSDVDCDDGDPAIHPEAEDPAGDGIDQNCDGVDGIARTIADLAYGDLVVTEFLPDPTDASDSDGEWFEIANRTPDPVALEGLVVRDEGSNSFTLGPATIEADGRLVIAASADLGVGFGGVQVVEWGSFSLSNGDDEIILEANGVLIDAVAYDTGAGWPASAGVAASLDPRRTSADANDDPANWCAATTDYGGNDLGTPGDPNPRCP